MDAFNLAERIKLLSPRTEEEASILALTFGAVYATALAEKYGYTVRKSHGGNDLVQEITLLVDKMVHTKIAPFDPTTPEENSWLAGLYFNDALVRADIAFEWTARYVGGFTPQDFGKICQVRLQAKQAGFPPNALASWKEIDKEVKTFKHRNQFAQDRMDYSRFFKAIEDLICAVEWCFTRPSCSNNFL